MDSRPVEYSLQHILTARAGFGGLKQEDLARPPSLFVGGGKGGGSTAPLSIPRAGEVPMGLAHTMPALHEFGTASVPIKHPGSVHNHHHSTSYHSDIPAGTSYDVRDVPLLL